MFVNQNTWKKDSSFKNYSSFCLASVFKNLTRHTFLIIFIVAAILLTELSLHNTFFHVQIFLEANWREASLLCPAHMTGLLHTVWWLGESEDNWELIEETQSCYRHSPVRPGLDTAQSDWRPNIVLPPARPDSVISLTTNKHHSVSWSYIFLRSEKFKSDPTLMPGRMFVIRHI